METVHVLTEVEEAFRNLKGDLAIRPIYHQLEHRIKAHIFVAFMAYCLHVTLRQLSRACAPGLTPRSILEQMKMSMPVASDYRVGVAVFELGTGRPLTHYPIQTAPLEGLQKQGFRTQDVFAMPGDISRSFQKSPPGCGRQLLKRPARYSDPGRGLPGVFQQILL